jgi:hypothetical protein
LVKWITSLQNAGEYKYLLFSLWIVSFSILFDTFQHEQLQFSMGLVPHSGPPWQGRRSGPEHCHWRVFVVSYCWSYL